MSLPYISKYYNLVIIDEISLEKGYNIREVYVIMEYDVSIPTLQKLEKEMKELEEEQK